MFFLRRRTLILKAVLVLTALWFMVALLTTSGNTRNAIGAPPEYDDPEAKPLKMGKSTSTKKKSESYGNNLSDGKSFFLFFGYRCLLLFILYCKLNIEIIL